MNSVNSFVFFISIIVCISTGISHKAKRAIVIGVDGFNPRCLPKGNIPNLMKFMNEGSSTLARSTEQAVSAPGWSSIICSLDPIDSGVIDNDYSPLWIKNQTIIENLLKSPPKITPVSGSNPWPCVFEQVKKQKPKMKTTYLYDWDWLANFNNKSMGYIDNDVWCKGGELDEYIVCDNKYISSLLKDISSKELGFAFYYIGELDEAGHTKNFCSEAYQQFITKVDSLVGQVLDELEKSGLDKETIVLLTSDHGATPGTGNHGDFNDDNLFVLWMVKGPNVKANYKIHSNVHNIDTMPTVLNLLGLDNYSDQWRGKPVKEIRIDQDSFLGN